MSCPPREGGTSEFLTFKCLSLQTLNIPTHFLGSYTSQPSKGAENCEFLVPGWAGSAWQPWGSLEGSVLEGVTPDSHPGGCFFGGMVHCLFQGSHGVCSWGFQCPPLWDFSVPVFDEWLFAWLPRAAEEECNFRHSFPCCLSNNSLSPSWKAHYSWAHLSQVQEHRDVFMEHCLFKGNSSKLLIQNTH